MLRPAERVDAEGHVARLVPGQPRRAFLRELERDLGARVADPNDEDGAFRELRRVAVFERVELTNRRIELRGERRDLRLLEVRHGDHHVVRLEGLVPRGHDEPFTSPREAVDARARADRQVESRRVRLEIVGHLVLRGRVAPRCGESHPGQRAVSGGGEQDERIPSVAPRVTDPRVSVEDDERAPATS